MICVTIDGQEIETEPGRTILEVARDHGVHIPTLCYHEALKPFAACRMCVVELENRRGGQLAPACTYPCEEGLIVQTNSEKVRRSRRTTIELLMASAAHVPLIRAMAEELGVTAPRFTMEPDDCILCGLCVRACDEIVGVRAISLINRGIEKKVGSPFQISSSDCIGCGTCVLICPTGAIKLSDIVDKGRSVHPWESDFEQHVCRLCNHHYLEPRFADASVLLSTEKEEVGR
jgi:NADH dehydrogenase/NADH:ubiquinone oxidoreductase subunit G